jgi:hypothetical protein
MDDELLASVTHNVLARRIGEQVIAAAQAEARAMILEQRLAELDAAAAAAPRSRKS